MWKKSLLSLSTFLYHIYWAISFDFTNRGLTSVPRVLPCDSKWLWLSDNRIRRLEDWSFQCLIDLEYLAVDKNNLIFINPTAFDPLRSLRYLSFRDNPDLTQLPPSFGPNTANMLGVYVGGNGIPDAPINFMQNMTSLIGVHYSFKISNEFFNGCDHLNTVWHKGPSAPNLTDRTPVLKYLWVSGVSSGFLPNENVRGLSRLMKVDINLPCGNIPVFEGATSLTTINATPCKVQSVPSLIHLPALQLLSFSTAIFECDQGCWWILLEDISSHAALSWLNTIVCKGPDNVKGQTISELSPVQTRCFQSEFLSHKWYFKYLIQMDTGKFNILSTLNAFSCNVQV